jgi:pilus assembly protein Flp/PilA
MRKLYIYLINRLDQINSGDDEGATMVEYGLIVAAIALVVVVGATVFGDALSSFFEDLADKL